MIYGMNLNSDGLYRVIKTYSFKILNMDQTII